MFVVTMPTQAGTSLLTLVQPSLFRVGGGGGRSPSQSHTVRWWQRPPVPGLLYRRGF